MTDEKKKPQDDIAGPHVGAGQARFGEPVRQGGSGLRRHGQRTDAVDQDTLGKHEPIAKPDSATPRADARGPFVPNDEVPNQAPEGVWRERKGPLNKLLGDADQIGLGKADIIAWRAVKCLGD
jgi:hypothetical protein